MNPDLNNSNNFYQSDDNQNVANDGPMITGLPENQFTPPQSSPYTQPLNSNYQQNDLNQNQPKEATPVDPFVPPEYEIVPPVSEAEENAAQQIDQTADIINWEAQDSIIGEKNRLWYVLFGVVIVALLAVSWLISSWTFAALIIVSAIAIVVVRTSSAARTVSYSLSGIGFYIDGKIHEYSQFKSFGVLKEPGVFSIVFLPKKRFSSSVLIYFPKESGEKIVDIIGLRLPMEEVYLDMIDKIVRKLKL